MKKLYVGNMSYNTTENDLLSRFQDFGEVASVHIITDRETGRARGFAFVEMRNDEQANRAIEAMNGQQIGGRRLNVREARPRAVWSGPRVGLTPARQGNW